MFLKRLSLKNFRNYPELEFQFNSKITLLLGNNAQGKSNFLESIFFLATTKSTRADQEIEMIRASDTTLHVEGELEGDTTLEIAMQENGGSITKRIKVNGVGRRLLDYAGNLVVVLFAPEDVNLVGGSPSLRRGYIDTTLSQIDREYKRTLANYENVITRRNKVLKRIRERVARRDELTYWSDQQILLGAIISEKRQEFFDYINKVEKKLGNFQFQYLRKDVTAEILTENIQKEIDSASSLYGPHRDDFIFLFNDRDLSKFGSRGEQRTAVLDLKLSEVAFFEMRLNTRPVLLLDDIFSELDLAHREHVLEVAKLQQTIIAAIELSEIQPAVIGEETKSYKVENGVVSPF